MKKPRRSRPAGSASLLACAIAGSATSTLASADAVDPAASSAGAGSAPASVLVVGKPSVTDLGPVQDRSSPQSFVGAQAIQQLQSPFADYGNIANLTPSYVSSAPNGAGWDAAKNQSMRGFTDGQFNVTVDGIPLQDPDTLGHHSTSWFPAMTLEGIRVDRSPGGATDVGYATFGGTLDQQTLDVPSSTSPRPPACACSARAARSTPGRRACAWPAGRSPARARRGSRWSSTTRPRAASPTRAAARTR